MCLDTLLGLVLFYQHFFLSRFCTSFPEGRFVVVKDSYPPSKVNQFFWFSVLLLQERTRGRGQGKTQCAQEGWTIGTWTVSLSPKAQMWQGGKASDFKELVSLAKKSICGVHHSLRSPHLHLHFRLLCLLD